MLHCAQYSNILLVLQGDGNSIEKEFDEGLDSELPPDSEVSTVGITACTGGTHACSPGPQVCHT